MITEKTFNENLPQFHKLIVEYLAATESKTFSFESNYVKDYHGKWCSYISIRLDRDYLELVVSYNEFYENPVLHHLRNHDPADLVGTAHSDLDIHPYIQRTFLLLHPCETKELMNTLQQVVPLRYLIAWFGIHLGFVSRELTLRVPESAFI